MASTVWRGFITFGLISVPVRLFRAARAERVNLRRLYRAPAEFAAPPHQMSPEAPPQQPEKVAAQQIPVRAQKASYPPGPPHPVLTPVQQVSVREGSNRVLEPQSLVKGYEYEKDRYVYVEAEELKSITPATTSEMQIDEFVQLAEVDPVYFETSYYVVPEEAGLKAYALLYRSLQLTGLVAVAQIAMHGREHILILRPAKKGLIAHTMFFGSEVRMEEEYPADTESLTAKELDLAQKLIHSLASSFRPEKYRDTYREKLESIIASRVAGQPAPVPERRSAPTPVVDIAEALQKSLAFLKKPAAKSAAAQRKKSSRGAG